MYFFFFEVPSGAVDTVLSRKMFKKYVSINSSTPLKQSHLRKFKEQLRRYHKLFTFDVWLGQGFFRHWASKIGYLCLARLAKLFFINFPTKSLSGLVTKHVCIIKDFKDCGKSTYFFWCSRCATSLFMYLKILCWLLFLSRYAKRQRRKQYLSLLLHILAVQKKIVCSKMFVFYQISKYSHLHSYPYWCCTSPSWCVHITRLLLFCHYYYYYYIVIAVINIFIKK